jgi:hypothetical protein
LRSPRRESRGGGNSSRPGRFSIPNRSASSA